jgi:hypothetical protein
VIEDHLLALGDEGEELLRDIAVAGLAHIVEVASIQQMASLAPSRR